MDQDDTQEIGSPDDDTRARLHHGRSRPDNGVVGPYRLIRELGRGGQAVVWLAEEEANGRQVALKLIRGMGANAPKMIQRFRREAEITSKLHHEGICGVFDAGFDEVPWIAMRYVKGETLSCRIRAPKSEATAVSPASFVSLGTDDATTLDVHSDERRPASSARLSTPQDLMGAILLIEKIARALHAAHEAGVIHRDIKPGNIMVTPDHEPIILDFGLAKEQDSDGPSLTMTGDLMGTPAYMSPEQIAAQRIMLDRRSDVYSLGVTLFESLTGRRPFEQPTRDALYNAILTEDMADPRRFNPSISVELKVVVETAMAKNRNDRYQTALDLAEELRRVRETKPIHARPPTPWMKLLRWSQRNPGVAASLSLAFFFLIAGLITTWILLGDAQESDLASQKNAKAASEARDDAIAGEKQASWSSYVGNMFAAESAIRSLEAVEARRRLDACPEEHRNFEWHHLKLMTDSSFRQLPGSSPFLTFALSPDGKFIAGGTRHNTIEVIDVETGESRQVLTGLGGTASSIAYSANGKVMVVGTYNGKLGIWDTKSGAKTGELQGHPKEIKSVAINSDGSRIISGDAWGSIQMWDAKTQKRLFAVAPAARVTCQLAFAPDENTFFSTSSEVQIWSTDTGKLLKQMDNPNHYRPAGGAFSPDGTMIAAGCQGVNDSSGKKILLWEAKTGELIATLDGHTQPIDNVIFTADGKRLISGSRDKTIRVWDLATRKEEQTLLGHEYRVDELAVTPDNLFVLTGNRESGASTFAINDGVLAARKTPVESTVWGIRVSQDGEFAMTVEGATFKVRRTADMKLIEVLPHRLGMPIDVADNDQILAARKGHGVVVIWDIANKKVLHELRSEETVATGSRVGQPSSISAVAFDQSGERLAVAFNSGNIYVWDTASGKELARTSNPLESPSQVIWGSDNKTLIVSDLRNFYTLDAATLQEISRIERSGFGFLRNMEWSADRTRLLASDDLLTPSIWNPKTGVKVCELKGHIQKVTQATFSPDFTRIATSSADKTIRLWDSQTGECVAVLRGHTSNVTCLAFTPDGKSLISGGDKTLITWRSERPAADEVMAYTRARTAEDKAKQYLNPLIVKYGVKSSVIEELGKREILDEIREDCLRLADLIVDDALKLYSYSRSIAAFPSKTPEQYARALKMAERAKELKPNYNYVMNTLGLALYRMGEHERALAVHRAADTANQRAPGRYNRINDLSFMAMSAWQLSRQDAAREFLKQAQAILNPSANRETRGFLQEAEALIRP